MTPMNPHQAPRSTGAGFVTGAIVGLGVGLALTCILFGVGFSYLQRLKADVRKGWNLEAVVVAAVDVKEGEPVTMEKLTQRSVPEQFVSASNVHPADASKIIDQPLRAPVRAGDPLLWQHFDRAFWK